MATSVDGAAGEHVAGAALACAPVKEGTIGTGLPWVRRSLGVPDDTAAVLLGVAHRGGIRTSRSGSRAAGCPLAASLQSEQDRRRDGQLQTPQQHIPPGNISGHHFPRIRNADVARLDGGNLLPWR
jgi:hypothetical protein